MDGANCRMELDGALGYRTEGRVCKVDSDIKRHFDSSYETLSEHDLHNCI